jgi:hypothetical protein
MVRSWIALLAAALAAVVVPERADAALFFQLDQTMAAPNERVTARARGAPAGKPLRLYLVPAEATAVYSRFDPQVHFVAALVGGRDGRAAARFSVPPIAAGTYTLAYWCPGCAPYSRGRTFFVQGGPHGLTIEATPGCPVTIPNRNLPGGQPTNLSWHGNGRLWGVLQPDGVVSVAAERVEPDGSISDKFLWATFPADRRPTITGRRLDAPAGPLRVLRVNHGSFVGAAKPSWATPLVFPTAGCWQLAARFADIRLTYVVRLVVENRARSVRGSRR